MTKKYGLFVLVWSLLLLMAFVSLANAQGKLRVAVVRFDNNSTWHWWGDSLGEAAADVFVTALMDSGKFSLIERQKVDAVLIEQDFGASGRVTPQTAAKIGKMLGVDLLLTGSVSQFSVSRTGGGFKGLSVGVTTGKVVLQARLVDATTGEIVVAAEEKNEKNLVGARYKSANFQQKYDYGLANEVMHPAVKKIVAKIVEKSAGMATSSHSGRVIKVEGNKVWVNIGANAGIKIGDEFEVVRKGEKLVDPDTGLVLGSEEESVGKIVVVEVKEKYSVATIQGGNAQAQDYLKKM
jgi:curli biogenesis system outer membrane secretion channel CsgG